VFSGFFPSISLAERQVFLDALVRLAAMNEHESAREAGLYLTGRQVRELASLGFEIGNHTYSHVRCRSLMPADMSNELDRNQAELEAVSGSKVVSFSVPYGSSRDLTGAVDRRLEGLGHKLVFLSESVANPGGVNWFRIDRVSIRGDKEDVLFLELEVLPRLRAARNRFFRTRQERRLAAGPA
jgi:hypothetical protein